MYTVHAGHTTVREPFTELLPNSMHLLTTCGQISY